MPGLTEPEPIATTTKNSVNGAQPGGGSLIDNMPAVNHDDDSIERATVLGLHMTNPYTVSNMQQAYQNLGLGSVTVSVTNLYVRFKPTISQVGSLDSLMDSQGLELFDAPMDYQVLEEGDYYQDPSIPGDQPTWQYAVVPPNFSFPAGITHETLAQIHIPADNYNNVETEAERLAGVQDEAPMDVAPRKNTGSNGYNACASGYHYEEGTHNCVPNNCPYGYHWDENSYNCAPDEAPPVPDAQVPSGAITVTDTQIPDNDYRQPVRRARIVAKRWFKVERTYTDATGHFYLTKHFKHKVKIRLKFLNDDASIRQVRGVRIWNMLVPITRTLGVYSADKINVNYNFAKFNTAVKAKGNGYWVAATVHNSLQEYKDYAAQQTIGQPASGLKIYLSRIGSGSSSTPLYAKRSNFSLSSDWVNENLLEYPLAAFVSELLAGRIDMIYNYKSGNNVSLLLSDYIKETAYHELTHAAHYTTMGDVWYTQFVNAELTAGINYSFSAARRVFRPYGDGTDSFSPIIALGESWAYHIGHFFTNLRYGAVANGVSEQGLSYFNNSPVSGLSSHLNLLEGFNPNTTTDPFHWIPQGLYYDLIDGRNDLISPPFAVSLDDQVVGYTNQQFFNAFNSGITSLQDFRVNLLLQNSNNQSAAVINLFQQYGY